VTGKYNFSKLKSETSFGFGGFMHSSFESKTDFAKPSKPAFHYRRETLI